AWERAFSSRSNGFFVATSGSRRIAASSLARSRPAGDPSPSMRRDLVLYVGLALLAGCGAPFREVELVGDPIVHLGRVVAARGPPMARTGDTCAVEVVRTDGSYLNCRIRVRCSGDLVYGLSGAGYNHCRIDG